MRALLGVLFAVSVGVSAPVSAQGWTPEQQQIWRVEEQMWRMDNAHDLGWIETYVHPNAIGWGTNDAVPRNRASMLRWDKYEYGNSTVLEFELFPLSVTITGNVAVVHYRYRVANENYKKERETATGRYTDVLIKDGTRWLLITTVGGDDPKR